MKLSYKNRNIILVCIGLMLLLSGIFQIILKIKVDAKISGYIQNGLLLLACMVFFVGRRSKKEKDDEDKDKEDEEIK